MRTRRDTGHAGLKMCSTRLITRGGASVPLGPNRGNSEWGAKIRVPRASHRMPVWPSSSNDHRKRTILVNRCAARMATRANDSLFPHDIKVGGDERLDDLGLDALAFRRVRDATHRIGHLSREGSHHNYLSTWCATFALSARAKSRRDLHYLRQCHDFVV